MVFSVPLRLALCVFIFCIWAEAKSPKPTLPTAPLPKPPLEVLLHQSVLAWHRAANFKEVADYSNKHKEGVAYFLNVHEDKMTKQYNDFSCKTEFTYTPSDEGGDTAMSESTEYSGGMKVRYDMNFNSVELLNRNPKSNSYSIKFTDGHDSQDLNVIEIIPGYNADQRKDLNEEEATVKKARKRELLSVNPYPQCESEAYYVFLNQDGTFEAVVSSGLRPSKIFLMLLLQYGDLSSEEYTLRKVFVENSWSSSKSNKAKANQAKANKAAFFVVTKKETQTMPSDTLVVYKRHVYETYTEDVVETYPCVEVLDAKEPATIPIDFTQKLGGASRASEHCWAWALKSGYSSNVRRETLHNVADRKLEMYPTLGEQKRRCSPRVKRPRSRM